MISLLLPYWNRQEAADKALALLEKQYGYWADLEVIVIDDGSPIPFKAPKTSLDLRVIRLPGKKEPKSPCSCWNEGAKAAKGEILVLSCIEILHDQRVLEPMLGELWRLGPKGYVLAAAYCPESQEWHCHTTFVSADAPALPKGCGRAFCGMLYKEFYTQAGGWDEDYREGAGYDDIDWVYRLLAHDAKFLIRDDLVVTHPKTGASIAWGAGKFERNRKLLAEKWPTGPRVPVTFVCLNAGNYCDRGVEYVNKLYDMVVRNMPPHHAFNFVCLTDDPEGLDKGIEAIPLPPDLEGWYGKLYLFKRGLFPDGSRMIFMDLDTVILGKLDDIVTYNGEFATCIDFFFPEQVGPAVMLWEAGKPKIWDAWQDAGRPRNPMGDLWWINNLEGGKFAQGCDKLQILYPGQFVSYKANCRDGIPKGARVCCFHGHPRPHEAPDEWVAMAWAIDGSVPANPDVVANSGREVTDHNIKTACKLDLPWLEMVKPHDGEIAIVGGGPSLIDFLPELKGRSIIATNGAYHYLASKGIFADHHLVIDAQPHNAKFINGLAKHYLLASQCDPLLYDLAGINTTVVHMHTEGMPDLIPQTLKPIALISSGSTVGLAGLAIAYCLGYRKIYLYGMDSSYEVDHHIYSQPMNDADAIVDVTAGGRKFKCAPWMVAQVQDFQKISVELANDGCEIYIRCGGLLAFVSWLAHGIPAQHAA